MLDAAQVDGLVYVVSEWVAATDLAGLLADGPLPAPRPAALATELAAALAAAHDAGLAHLCLQPEHVLRTAHGQLKVAGLAVDAAARGIDESDPRRRPSATSTGSARCSTRADRPVAGRGDHRAAPGASTTTPRATRDRSARCVPHDLDELTCRALGCQGPARAAGGPPRAWPSSGGRRGGPPAPGRVRRDPGGASVRRRWPRTGGRAGRRRRGSQPVPRSGAGLVAAAVVLVTGLVLFGGSWC